MSLYRHYYSHFTRALKVLVSIPALCLFLTACSTFGDEQNASNISAATEINCKTKNENAKWQVSTSKKKMTVNHRYQNSEVHCETLEKTANHEPIVEATKGSTLFNLLRGETVAAKVDIELDPTQKHSDKSTVHFTAI